LRILRFRCAACGLDIAMPDKPAKCFCCGSTNIVREGWGMRFRKKIEKKRSANG